jgi:2-hydroxy-3-keto-5-methylthiopentenyl-1-phosphate phosphatase
MRFSVSCDFDGTITLSDTVNALLTEFAEPEWLAIEEDWCSGKFGSRECLAAQTKLLRIQPDKLDAYIDAVAVDPGVKTFFDDCFNLNIPVTVVSDGYDWAIRRVLSRIGVRGVPIVANRLVHVGEDRWAVLFPHSAQNCGSGVCKCAAANAKTQMVHIGDGRSDVCVSDLADIVFAKGHLLQSRTERGLSSVPFERFHEICALLPELDALAPVPTPALVQRSA